MKTSRLAACGAIAGLALVSLLAAGCSSTPALPEGGVDPATLAQRNTQGQMQVYQTRKQNDPALQPHPGAAPANSGMESGQAAAMKARMAAQGGHP